MDEDRSTETRPAGDAGAPEQAEPRQESSAKPRGPSRSAQEMRLAIAQELWRQSTDASGAITEVNRAMIAAELAKAPRVPTTRGTRRSRAANDGGSADEDTLELPVIVHRFITPGDDV
jgi:hypothetical protein